MAQRLKKSEKTGTPQKSIELPNGRSRLNKTEGQTTKKLKPETRQGVVITVLIALAFLSVLSLFGWAGGFGRGLDKALGWLFGWARFVFPVVLLVWSNFLYKPQKFSLRSANYFGLLIGWLGLSGLLELFVPVSLMTEKLGDGTGGGVFGLISAWPLMRAMGYVASIVVLLAMFIIGLLIMFDTSLNTLADQGNIFKRLKFRWLAMTDKLRANKHIEEIEPPPAEPDLEAEDELEFDTKELAETEIAQSEQQRLPKKPEYLKPKVRRKIAYSLDLLDFATSKPTSGDIAANQERIQKTLANFGLEVEMGEVNVGPTVTQFTLKPADGVKLNSITALSNDLALALAAHPIRIEAPIPGKSLVGIEVPNQAAALVRLVDILKSKNFEERKSVLTVAVGKSVTGEAWVADVDRMPHLLIAGATGSGKSVCINAILLSLLFENGPDDLKLILVDPKRVELTIYNGIPHLLTPVITEVPKIINALRWVVNEMDRRFQVLSQAGKRNIQAYNQNSPDPLPFLVVVIDELADLMAVAAREVEAAIIRLAQMARAVGIHLIVATQRPSVDVITGLIKANITHRMAFTVASAIDSRTILDSPGAEKLLGRGDMLYSSPELSKPKRLQGCFVSDKEIEKVVTMLKEQAQPEYLEEIVEKPQGLVGLNNGVMAGEFLGDESDDELLVEAKNVILRAQKASASLLQRRLRIGYARAARLLDLLEEQGVIGPGEGAKPREILISSDPDADIPVPAKADGPEGGADAEAENLAEDTSKIQERL
ncbi:DNA translocase FtsK [Candidatus Parcubacteria bacterium]|jgi:S-DNA-T family DNA segregation ATPase FtsK/SpoIIIE|nr:MAG: DNA translocase FtsK [Candidatus Parcubacteria bacterium]